jgi:hypothetical protein
VLVVIRARPSRLWANPSFFQLGGWDPCSASLADVLSPADQESVVKATGIQQAIQRPGQIEVCYHAKNGSARMLWLHYRPLVPTSSWDRDLGDSRCEGSSTVICSCAWGPLCDYRELMFSLLPDWISGWEVCSDDLSSRTWFYNRNVGRELLHTDDPFDRLGVAAALYLTPRADSEFFCVELQKLVVSGEWQASFKRTFTWEGKQRLTNSRLLRLPGKWGARGLTRGIMQSTDVTHLEAVMDELAQTRLQLDRGARRVDLLEKSISSMAHQL